MADIIIPPQIVGISSITLRKDECITRRHLWRLNFCPTVAELNAADFQGPLGPGLKQLNANQGGQTYGTSYQFAVNGSSASVKEWKTLIVSVGFMNDTDNVVILIPSWPAIYVGGVSVAAGITTAPQIAVPIIAPPDFNMNVSVITQDTGAHGDGPIDISLADFDIAPYCLPTLAGNLFPINQ